MVILFLCVNYISTKQCVDPESTSARVLGKSKDKRITCDIRELGS